ncbi:MAG: OmpH family outer membrane protein [Bacteroidota bacterium]
MKNVNMKTKLLMTLALAIITVSSMAQAQKPQKIGTLNMEYVLSAMPEIKSIQSTLGTLQAQLQKQGEAKQTQYQQKVGRYQAEGASMTIGDRQQLEREIAALEEEMQTFGSSAQSRMETKQAELMGPINKKVGEALEAIVAEHGFTHIFNVGVPQAGLEILYYIDPAYDVSNMVLKKMGIEPPVN